MRLFVALSLPADLRSRLCALSSGLPGARWVDPANLHLTLRFIGEVGGHEADDVDAALSGINGKRFSLTLSGLGQFGGDRRLRALWAGVEPNEALDHLQAKIETALQRAGLAPEKRKFKPHVTLARFKANPGERLQDYIVERSLFRAEPFEVTEFVLYSSYLAHKGAIYAPEATYPLI
ncbi:RNA 2',3'-cyclic phosphodiesterase [Pelagibius litoralis]|uniref:RNA 2',3'-cyclic phosphodiesterase n=1 Tax=Pelagibius litoralis TaxID=374515 RepID=A0A967F0V9_9PROT|nr:RNA 2',3'-cyclic phosphodiesterase [Pelagibius litoralis]NIA71066.1 RNA 2',3'-cyclic phosphodiesterase [Pelagibius litoralis]